jgi:hypothetical protein
MTRSGMSRRLAIAVLAIGLFGTASTAQRPRPVAPLDPLAEAQARQKIEGQKAEAEVLAAIQTADKLYRLHKRNAQAIQVLKSAQVNTIDLSVSLSSETRKTLTGMIEAKIAQIEGRPLTAPVAEARPDPKAVATRNDRRSAYENYVAEITAVNEGIQKIAKYKQAGLNAEANREITALAHSYPNNPAVIRLQEQDTLGTRVTEARDFLDQQNKRITLAMSSVDQSSLPAKGDVEFPRNWKDKDSRKYQGVKLSEKEKKIIEALNKPVTVNFNGKMLEEALQELSNTLDQNLFLDKKSLTELGLDLSKGVNLQANGVSARTVLRQLLGAQGLTFVVKDEVIQIVTVEKARDLLVTRVYYLGDLAEGVGPFGGVAAGPLLNLQQTLQNVDVLIKSIQQSVDPLCWKANGGPCTITFHYPSMSIIVRGSAEVHGSLSATFGGR